MVLQLKESQSMFHQSHLAASCFIHHRTAQVIKGKLLIHNEVRSGAKMQAFNWITVN